MIKEFMKMANKKTEKDFLKAYPTEESFFNAFPQARIYARGGGIDNPGFRALPPRAKYNIISNMAYGGYYADGGEQQMAPQQEGGGNQQEQIIMMIVQALQQGMSPEEVVAKLAEAGIPEQQGAQLVQAVMQRIQQMQQSTPQPGQMPEQGPEAQGPSPQEGMMKKGGEFDGTYYQGTYFRHGGLHKNKLPIAKYGMDINCPIGYTKDENGNCVPMFSFNNKMKDIGSNVVSTLTEGLEEAMQKKVKKDTDKTNNIYFGDTSNKQNINLQPLAPPLDPWSYGPASKNSLKRGGSTKKKQYKKGGEYEMSQEEIQDLINKGYKIKYL